MATPHLAVPTAAMKSTEEASSPPEFERGAGGDATANDTDDGGENDGSDGNDAEGDSDDRTAATNYCSRKPKWWTQLSGRRGTRSQRAAIRRMTDRGYCVPKEVLTEFSRLNNNNRAANRRRQQMRGGGNDDEGPSGDGGEDCNVSGEPTNEWKRTWWDRSLGIRDAIAPGSGDLANDDGIVAAASSAVHGDNIAAAEKYAHKVREMCCYKSPLLQPGNGNRGYERIWLEIGFGNGDNLLANAENRPDTLFMGCEIHQPGVGTVLRRMEEELLGVSGMMCAEGEELLGDQSEHKNDASARPTTSDGGPRYQNVRVLPGDGVKLLHHLPDDYLDAILLTFPDPWPKESHAHWRVIQREVLREMHRVLKKGRVNGEAAEGSISNGDDDGLEGGRVFVATDAECFYNWTREVLLQEIISSTNVQYDDSNEHGGVIGISGGCSGSRYGTAATHWKEVVPCPDRQTWLPVVSYYEQKGLDEGRFTKLQCWQVAQK